MSRAEAFQRLSSQRIAKAQKAIQLIGNLSNKNNYQFEIDEVEQLIKTLEVEIEQLRIKFKIEQPRAADPEIPSITEDLELWGVDLNALSWIQWGRDKIIHGNRTDALEMINKGIEMIKNKEERS